MLILKAGQLEAVPPLLTVRVPRNGRLIFVLKKRYSRYINGGGTPMIYAFGEVMMRLEAPHFQKLQQASELLVSYSGTGVNILSGLSHFGHRTALVTKLPTNSIGIAALAHLQSLGIETSHIVRGGDTLGLYFLERGFGGRASAVTYTDRSNSSFCTSECEEYDFANLQKSSVIHFCGISLAVSSHTRQLTLAVAKKAKAQGLTISFDCNYRPKLWGDDSTHAKSSYEEMLHLADICFMTEKDARFILELPTTQTEKEKQIEDLLPQVADAYKIQTIAGTIRDTTSISAQTLKGFIVREGTVTYSHVHNLHVLDRIGGGDGFVSGILHGLHTKVEPNNLIDFATAAGVLAHTTVGDSPVSSLADIKRFTEQTIDIER